MSPEILSIVALAAMFVIATVLPINMGALAFVAAFLLGTLVLAMDSADILAGFPGDLFLVLVGITYLFAIAQNNGTVDLLVRGAVRLVGGWVAAIPWVMFAITGVLTAMGALGPAAVAIIAPIALGFAARYSINPLLMGMMVVHGAQAGGFSPISVYGATVNGIVAGTDLESSPTTLFLASLLFNTGIALVLFLVLGGRKLIGVHSRQFEAVRTGGREQGAEHPGSEGAESPSAPSGPSGFRLDQAMTVLGLVVLGVLALGFKMDVGFVAISVSVVLAVLFPKAQKDAVSKISWSTVLLLGGVLTFVHVMEEAGTIEFVGDGVAGLGSPLLVALLLCYIGGIVSAFASSTAILGVTIPLAVPFLLAGDIGAIGVIAALAVASTIVDVSPFSTNGALVLANARGVDPDRFYKQILGYGAIVVAVGPLLAWAVMVLPDWL
ncbi:SLC13 family permease [Actinorugispora endophytica]|uniref:UIT1 family transporter n=1 Tax=Actinorugispora endophytica TaxID=1605990 RepID=A0A4R6ULP0_9ACTN|nr:SLC13 family permease [Actinorugispora endophytica]TDQ47950.1 UIT1 family transporter [Actinorugispora endophytica]